MFLRYRRIIAILLIFGLAVIPTLATPDQGQGEDDVGSIAPSVTHQDADEAFAHDARLMAEQTDMPIEQVESALAFQEALVFYGIEVLTPLYEDQISGIWADPAPATRSYVRFVGEVPEHARVEAERRGLDIVFIANGEISMADQGRRSDLTASALVAAGYQNFIVGPNQQELVIQIELMLPEGDPAPDIDEIVELVREYVATVGGGSLDGRAAEIRTSDLELNILRGSGPIVVFD